MGSDTDWVELADQFKADTREPAGFFSWEFDKSVT